MDPLQAATDSASAISTIGSHFMLAGPTYARGAEAGFSGLDFYFRGRAGVLGEVDAGVVAATLAFFEPTHVRTQWEAGRGVMPAGDAAQLFAACAATWAAEHVPDDLDAARLAALAGAVVERTPEAIAPIFAGWRTLPVPEDPKAAAVHHLNALRELRFAYHAAAVLTSGLSVLEAMSLRSPHMLQLFGWAEGVPTDGLQERWDAAEAQTDVSMARALAVLEDAERAELVELANALHAATS